MCLVMDKLYIIKFEILFFKDIIDLVHKGNNYLQTTKGHNFLN